MSQTQAPPILASGLAGLLWPWLYKALQWRPQHCSMMQSRYFFVRGYLLLGTLRSQQSSLPTCPAAGAANAVFTPHQHVFLIPFLFIQLCFSALQCIGNKEHYICWLLRGHISRCLPVLRQGRLVLV